MIRPPLSGALSPPSKATSRRRSLWARCMTKAKESNKTIQKLLGGSNVLQNRMIPKLNLMWGALT